MNELNVNKSGFALKGAVFRKGSSIEEGEQY